MKCPNCNTIVPATGVIDTEYQNKTYYDQVEGACPNCGKIWSWVEVFTFDHYEDIEGIEIDDPP